VTNPVSESHFRSPVFDRHPAENRAGNHMSKWTLAELHIR